MKLLVTATLFGSAVAFTPAVFVSNRIRVRAFAETEETTAVAEPEPTAVEEPAAVSAPAPQFINTPQEVVEGSTRAGQNSFSEVNTNVSSCRRSPPPRIRVSHVSFPLRQIFVRPALFDEVKLAGDSGFDPFQLASDKATLLSYRGAELRHGRLAMLATVGWPMSELVQPSLATALGLPVETAKGGLAPSVLNGGLGQISPVFWLGTIALADYIELESLDREKEGKMPGDVGFDPLGMKSEQMEEAELANGRLAMLAITGFAVQEAFTKLLGAAKPVIDETPFFFHPVF